MATELTMPETDESPPDLPSRATMNPVTTRRRPLTVFSGRVWRAYGFEWLALLLMPFAFTYSLLPPVFAAGLGVTIVGLFVAGGLVLGARGWGGAYRGIIRVALDADIVAPPKFVRPRGFWRSIGAMLFDGTGWRSLLHMLAQLPLTCVTFVISNLFFWVGFGGITYWFWRIFVPAEVMFDGTSRRGWMIGKMGSGLAIDGGSVTAETVVGANPLLPDGFGLFEPVRGSQGSWYWVADTPPRLALVAIVGLAFLAAWPYVQHGLATLHRLLAQGLLGPTAGAVRVAVLRAQRKAVVEDADARLRRIERELHDGTQARLVAVAMQLGEARDVMADDPATASELLDQAHTSTKEALVELRDIARGIRPPALDAGLAVAVETLAARSALPTTVDIEPFADEGLSPAIGSIAYFAIAELVTNVAKHAHASGAYIHLERAGNALHVRVRDDGRGGAVIVPGVPGTSGSGLAGLAERIAAVDGTITVTSPPGGPTIVDIAIPVGHQK
jgi:signal transduction histidine kinase